MFNSIVVKPVFYKLKYINNTLRILDSEFVTRISTKQWKMKPPVSFDYLFIAICKVVYEDNFLLFKLLDKRKFKYVVYYSNWYCTISQQKFKIAQSVQCQITRPMIYSIESII